MKLSLLPLLAAPCCAAPLRFSRLEQMPDEEIDDGVLACAGCGREYPIISGVPRLLPAGAKDARVVRTSASFCWEWTRYPGSLAEDRGIFLEESQLCATDLKGKLVLDAGCGMGRYALVALDLGAEVVALDLSESLLRLADAARVRPNLHLVQGNLLKPPLKAGTFDFVYSHGVLHHTPDTRAAFQAVAGLVKPNGRLSVWLYGKAGRYRDFATNPLRPDRLWVARHRRLSWIIVAARQLISDVLRVFTVRLPLPLTYALCYPLAWLGALPALKYLTFSAHRDFRVRLIENFDWLSPPFQFHHTKEELSAWYETAGYDVLRLLAHGLVPKPGILGRRR
ncbi:MAG TPA: class I SAM-dependent methyltransferase [Elusimicrobia bacterium]|nr:class I SAM-dependent methyltransferase [Elusimicrobiota bacterium]HBT61914.1 class I SAM-dependent methyltransferase [Elusimicrobiota bacterium]